MVGGHVTEQWWNPDQPTTPQQQPGPQSGGGYGAAPPPGQSSYDAPEQPWAGGDVGTVGPPPSGGKSSSPLLAILGAVALGAVGLGFLFASNRDSTVTTGTTVGTVTTSTVATSQPATSAVGTVEPASSENQYGFPEGANVGSYCARVLGFEYEVDRYYELFESITDEAAQYRLEYEYVQYTIRVLGDIADVAPPELQSTYLLIRQPWVDSTSMESINEAFDNDPSLLTAEDQVYDHMNTQCAAFYDG